jgi:hypothetical protein
VESADVRFLACSSTGWLEPLVVMGARLELLLDKIKLPLTKPVTVAFKE